MTPQREPGTRQQQHHHHHRPHVRRPASLPSLPAPPLPLLLTCQERPFLSLLRAVICSITGAAKSMFAMDEYPAGGGQPGSERAREGVGVGGKGPARGKRQRAACCGETAKRRRASPSSYISSDRPANAAGRGRRTPVGRITRGAAGVRRQQLNALTRRPAADVQDGVALAEVLGKQLLEARVALEPVKVVGVPAGQKNSAGRCVRVGPPLCVVQRGATVHTLPYSPPVAVLPVADGAVRRHASDSRGAELRKVAAQG